MEAAHAVTPSKGAVLEGQALVGVGNDWQPPPPAHPRRFDKQLDSRLQSVAGGGAWGWGQGASCGWGSKSLPIGG